MYAVQNELHGDREYEDHPGLWQHHLHVSWTWLATFNFKIQLTLNLSVHVYLITSNIASVMSPACIRVWVTRIVLYRIYD